MMQHWVMMTQPKVRKHHNIAHANEKLYPDSFLWNSNWLKKSDPKYFPNLPQLPRIRMKFQMATTGT